MSTPRRAFATALAVAGLVFGALSPVVGAAEGPAVEPVVGSDDLGDLAGLELAEEVVAMVPTGSGNGYWLVAADGGVFTFGDAVFHGSTGALTLDQPVVGMAATPSGAGYWLVAADGGIFSFGDATFHGSMGGIPLNQPVVGMAATPSGAGYWLVAADGGIFSFGDATFHGSTGNLTLDEPIVSMAATTTGRGYWLLGDDGGVFTFGDATFHGSTVEPSRHSGGLAIGANREGGYSILTDNGAVESFGPGPAASAPPLCRGPAVRGGAITDDRAWLYTTSLEIPRPGFHSGATSIDGASIAEQLLYLQACQTARAPQAGEMIRPAAGVVSSRFGIRRHPIWNIPILHAGVDIAAPGGTPVSSSADGTVVAITERSAYGTTILVDHGDRIATVYAHLGSVDVQVGQQVQAGTVLGLVGMSGFVTGAHLHIELRVDGVPIDPRPIMGI